MGDKVATRTTVDLTPLMGGRIECAVGIQFNTLNQAEELSVTIENMSADHFNRLEQGDLAVEKVFGNAALKGTFEDGTLFDGHIEFIKSCDFGRDQITLTCQLDSFTTITPDSDGSGGTWVFQLANLHFVGGGDSWTTLRRTPADQATTAELFRKNFGQKYATAPVAEHQLSGSRADSFSRRRNRINFEFANRTWQLDDDLMGRWPRDLTKISGPILSGTLSTERQTHDSEADLQQAATDINDLLTFALGRDVKWVGFGHCDADGRCSSGLYQSLGLLAFNQADSPPVANWEPGNLRQFLEVGETILASDRAWWRITIGLLAQARGTREITVKCSLLNTLLDRVSTKVIGDEFGNEIDAGLDERVDQPQFQESIHQVLTTLTSKWTAGRTESLCGTIKNWNAEPSFPDKVIRACDKLDISAPTRKILGLRHKLIHRGEFDRQLKTHDEKVEYLHSIESIVRLLLIRLLGFAGYIYVRKKQGIDGVQTDYVLVADLLTAQ